MFQESTLKSEPSSWMERKSNCRFGECDQCIDQQSIDRSCRMSIELHSEPECVDDRNLNFLLQGHSGTGEVQDHHHGLLQRSHGKTCPLHFLHSAIGQILSVTHVLAASISEVRVKESHNPCDVS